MDCYAAFNHGRDDYNEELITLQDKFMQIFDVNENVVADLVKVWSWNLISFVDYCNGIVVIVEIIDPNKIDNVLGSVQVGFEQIIKKYRLYVLT